MYSSQSWPNKDPPMVGSFPQSEQDARSKFRYSAKFPYRQQNTPSAPPPPTISSGSKGFPSGTPQPSHLSLNEVPVSSSYLPSGPSPTSTFVSSFVPVQSSHSNGRTNHKVSNARPNNIEIRVQEDIQPRSPLAQRYENDWRNPQLSLNEAFRNPDSPFDHVNHDRGFKTSHSNYENDETISKQPNREAKRNTRALDINDPAQLALQLDHPENFASKLRIIRDAIDGNQENESRCNLCPSPGLLKEEEKDAHVHTVHFSSLFQCAACYKKGFEAFDDIVVHIHTEHQVTDPQMVLETIKLPEGRDKLKIWRCGVTNCRRKFVGLSELMLKSHMHNNHGSYYLKVGKGKYIERFCRICGDDKSFGSEQDLDHHIFSNHPLQQFAPALSSDSDNGSDIIEVVRIKQEPVDKHDTPKIKGDSNNKKNVVEDYRENPVSNKKPSNNEKQKQSMKVPCPTVKREKRGAVTMKSSKSPMKSPVPMFGEPLPEETNRILEETSYLIKDHPLVFEEQKRRILGDSLFEGSTSELYDKNPKPTFGEPIAENFTLAKIPRSVEKQSHDDASNARAIIRSACQLPPPVSARSQLPPPIRARRSRTPEKSIKVAQKRKSRTSSSSSSSSSGSSSDSRSPSPKLKKVKKVEKQNKESFKKKAMQPTSTKNIPSKLFSNAINQVEQQHQSPRINKNKICLPDMSRPKFMLDGRPAYYICELCEEPVGTVFSWIRHRTKRKSHLALYTKEYSKSKDVKEASVSSNPSVLEKFGDKSKKCLACDTNFANNNDLRVHEDESEHKSKLVSMELKDIAELKSSGEVIKTLFHCDMCDEAVAHPKVHIKEYSHMAKLTATKRCYYCPKRFHPPDLNSHISQHHSKNLFKCTICASKMMSKIKMLDHIKTHQKHLFSKTHEELTIFTLPSDLRKIKCGICSQGVFMSQETSEAMNHVIDEHPQVGNVAKAIKFGCQACPQLSFENDDVMNKHVRGFHDPMRVPPKPTEKGFSPGYIAAESQKEKVAQKLNHYYVTRKVPESNSGTSVQNSSKAKTLRKSHSRSRSKERMEKNSERTLFVGGLSQDTQDLDLKRHFEQWGKLTDYTVKQGTYGSRGFGFVTFAREEDLDKCIECREHWIKDNKITVGQSNSCWKGEKTNQSPRKWSRSRSRHRMSSRSPRRSRSRPRVSSRSLRRSRSRQKRSSRSLRRSRSRPRRSSRSPRRSRSRQRRSSRSPKSSRGRRSPVDSRMTRRSRSRARISKSAERRVNTNRRNMAASPEADESTGEKRIIHMRKSTEISNSDGDSSCPLCQEGFSSQDTVVAHMKWRHSSQMFQCEMCRNFSGWNRENLQYHLASVHSKKISMAELLRNYTLIPSRLHRINCKLCQPPHILGSKGFWIGSNLTANMKSILEHFLEQHSIKEESTATSMLELACRGCDATYSPGDRFDWEDHVRTDHSRASEPQPGRGTHRGTASKDTGKKCDYCKETVTASDSIRHIREAHSEETFLCKICLSADKNCFPFFDKMKEMMSHMVLKHGNEFSSYYDHIIYPKNLGWMRCMVPGCEARGKFSAYNRDLLKDHGLFFHSGIPDRKFMAIHCRNCDGVKEHFEDDAQLKDHIELKHKQIVAWKAKNGHN